MKSISNIIIYTFVFSYSVSIDTVWKFPSASQNPINHLIQFSSKFEFGFVTKEEIPVTLWVTGISFIFKIFIHD